MKKTIFLCLFCLLFPFFIQKETKNVQAETASFRNFSISSGKNHSLLKTDTGEIFAWGTWGDISLESDLETFSKIYPSDITNLISLQNNDSIKEVSSGDQHSFILTEFGEVYSFGFDGQGQLGDGGEVYFVGDLNYASQLKKEASCITELFDLQPGDKIIQVDGGSNFSIALSQMGDVFTFGENNNGQLGINQQENVYQTAPIKITENFDLQEDEQITKIAVGSSHALALTQLGNVFVWGNNNFGQLGNDKRGINAYKPEKLELYGEKAIQIACGSFHSYVLTNLNFLYGFGYNGYGQLADKAVIVHTGNDKSVPYEMSKNFNLEVNEKIVDIYSGFFYGMAITSNHNIFSFGQNSSGQLGTRTNISISTPQKITQNVPFSTEDQIQSLALGEKHSLMVSSRGEVYSWGDNSSGQLGEDYSISLILTPNDITENFPPIISFSTLGSSIYQQEYEVSVKIQYINHLAIEEFSYAWSHTDQEKPIDTWENGSTDQPICLKDGDGTYYLWIQVVNLHEISFYKVSSAFYADSIKPTLQVHQIDNTPVNSNEIVDGSVYVKASDNNEGVKIAYRIDFHGDFVEIDEKEHVFNEDGTYEIKAIDVANNQSDIFLFRIDTQNPYILSMNQDLIQNNTYFTREKKLTIQSSELVLGYFLNDQDYITALNEESDEFTIQLKKGKTTIRLVDISGKVSQVYEIDYKPYFLEDTELLLWIFGTTASAIILIVVIVYTIRSKKQIKNGLK